MTKRTEKNDDKSSPKKSQLSRVTAARKVFYLENSFLNNDLCLERFFHPGKNEEAYFLTANETLIMEVLEFAEPRRSWLINQDVCSNGRLYMTTPFDVTLFAVHYLRKHCTKKSLALDGLCADLQPSAIRLLTKFLNVEQMRLIADVRRIDDTDYYKYNAGKTLAWLAVKTRRVAQSLLDGKVHCGVFAQSANYNPVENEEDQVDRELNALTMACGIVGSYLDEELNAELIKYFNLTDKSKEQTNGTKNKMKRKSAQELKSNEQKKIKVDPNEKLDYFVPESIKSNNSGKERVLTTKEKQLAKGAKGTKSISSFFKK